MKAKNKNLNRGLALALVLVLTAAIIAMFRTSASAYTSLSHIQSIKATQTVFNILEIAPQVGTGSLGYYADGQEPTSDWLSKAALKTTPEARAAYATGIFDALKARGLMNAETTDSDAEKDKYPLTYTGAYSEAFPWAVGDGQTATLLKLRDENGDQRVEQATVNGIFTAADDGAFKLNSEATFVPNGTGSYNQNVMYFVHGEYTGDDGTNVYYYIPEFVQADTSNAAALESLAGKALYSKTGDDSAPVFEYEGTLGVNDFRTTTGVTYYALNETTQYAPTKTYVAENANLYYAVADGGNPYVATTAGTGYFNITETDYEYVGDGLGAYSLTLDASGAPHIVKYNAVYVDARSGYTNNNWFLRYVFDVDKADIADPAKSNISIRVDTIVPSAVNATTDGQNTLKNLIDSYDMVVISAGFDYATGEMPATKYTADTDTSTVDNDFTKEQANAVKTALTGKKPVLVDSRLAADDYTADGKTVPNIETLVKELLTGKTAPIVTGSLYCFAPDDNITDDAADDRTALITKNFAAAFSPTLSAGDGKPYSEVRAGIEYENFLRKNADNSTTDLLPTDITMANSIRYIINYNGQLEQNKKTKISVLDVEPLTQKSSGSSCLSKATVAEWVKGSEIATADNRNISITTMSTAEFITKIDDINEEYDLVYIGASTDNFTINTAGNTVYNDASHMNGLLYSNIGDTSSGNSNLSGLVSGSTYRYSGNDITAPKATQLSNFAASGFPVIVADDLISEAQEATTEWQLDVTINATAVKVDGGRFGYDYYNVNLNAVPRATSGGNTIAVPNGLTYTWYYVRNGTRTPFASAEDITTAAYSTYNIDGYFYCEVKYNNYTATSNQIVLSNSAVSISCDKQGGDAVFTVGVPAGAQNVSYKWYRLYYQYYLEVGTNSPTYTGDRNTRYICRVQIGETTYYTQSAYYANGYDSGAHYESVNGYYYDYYNTRNWIYFSTSTSSNWTSTTIAPGTPATIPGQTARDESVNTETVDKNSILYSTLSANLTRNNVMSESQAASNTTTLLKYLNLSKPSIELSQKPTPYNNDFSKSLVTDQTLRYTFTIANPTDPTPVATRYTCGLYIDLNSDGKYSDDELISDLTITDANNNVVSEDALAAGKEYTVTRYLPDNYCGIIPWRLMVTQNGTDERIHASEIDYTYIKPKEATKINILQITSKEQGSTYVFKLKRAGSDDWADSSKNWFEKCFAQLKKEGLYDISVEYKSVTELNAMNSASIKTLFDKYNMLVIGFCDMYGDNENGKGLNENAAKSVTAFIETGKAVLFSHDTTSFYNTNSGWGYYFNSVIRGSVGLDRYGVKGKDAQQSYTTAYVPKSNGTAAGQIQGYTNLTLKRYSGSGDGGITDTKTVSQSNSGQITTFPYQIAQTITVANTHEQYYQLNMSSDDTVVWYCLSGSNYTNYKNDGTNAYYIYNKGNVTYTGAGHTVGDSAFGEYEAKLFVNTMVAAYRAAAVDPKVDFKTADKQSITTQILPVDINGTTVSAAETTRVYFTISDTNLVSNKSVSIAMYYMDGTNTLTQSQQDALIKDGTLPTGYKSLASQMTIYSASGTAVSGKLHSDVLYYVEVPANVVNASTAASITILGVATTEIGKEGNTAQYRGMATLNLQKAGYMILK